MLRQGDVLLGIGGELGDDVPSSFEALPINTVSSVMLSVPPCGSLRFNVLCAPCVLGDPCVAGLHLQAAASAASTSPANSIGRYKAMIAVRSFNAPPNVSRFGVST